MNWTATVNEHERTLNAWLCLCALLFHFVHARERDRVRQTSGNVNATGVLSVQVMLSGATLRKCEICDKDSIPRSRYHFKNRCQSVENSFHNTLPSPLPPFPNSCHLCVIDIESAYVKRSFPILAPNYANAPNNQANLFELKSFCQSNVANRIGRFHLAAIHVHTLWRRSVYSSLLPAHTDAIFEKSHEGFDAC